MSAYCPGNAQASSTPSNGCIGSDLLLSESVELSSFSLNSDACLVHLFYKMQIGSAACKRRPTVDKYKLASRCLSSHRSSFLEVVDNTDTQSAGFSMFEDLVLSCGDPASDMTEMFIVIWFLSLHLNRHGINEFLRITSFNDPVLLAMTRGLIAHCELSYSRMVGIYAVSAPLKVSNDLVGAILESLQNGSNDLLDKLSKNGTLPEVLTAVFKLHYFIRNSRYGDLIHKPHIAIERSWSILCHEYLSNPAYAMLRQKLLHLDDIHGPKVLKRFPPQENSFIYVEGKVRAEFYPGLFRVRIAPMTYDGSTQKLPAGMTTSYEPAINWQSLSKLFPLYPPLLQEFSTLSDSGEWRRTHVITFSFEEGFHLAIKDAVQSVYIG
ncbi:hypothetical protein SCHPADRAFT_895815 [Schizopora paradoxa]|uniref:Uncharacterized protein n=1 Tax=Schizopora paradoxa TaxID=27342 RepID=A0A0H2RME4_9AGAM|nr:hypothetical protein SCHPADRAFT_895815 [Schizopora paradoxa]